MPTDDADRRALEILPPGTSPGDYDVQDLRDDIATAIRAAVDTYRQRVCAVLADALPGAADLLRREGGK